MKSEPLEPGKSHIQARSYYKSAAKRNTICLMKGVKAIPMSQTTLNFKLRGKTFHAKFQRWGVAKKWPKIKKPRQITNIRLWLPIDKCAAFG